MPYCTSIVHDLGQNFPNNYTAEVLLVPTNTWIHDHNTKGTCGTLFDPSYKPGTMIYLSAFLYTVYIYDTFQKHEHKCWF